MQDILHVLYFFLIESNLKKMGLLKSNFQLQLAAKLVRDTFYPFTNGFSNVLQTSKTENTVNDLKCPLPNKRLLSVKHHLYAVKIILDAPL